MGILWAWRIFLFGILVAGGVAQHDPCNWLNFGYPYTCESAVIPCSNASDTGCNA